VWTGFQGPTIDHKQTFVNMVLTIQIS